MELFGEEGRTFMQVISEKYSPENFPYRRGPGMGVVVVPTGPQGSPMKGKVECTEQKNTHTIFFIQLDRFIIKLNLVKSTSFFENYLCWFRSFGW